MRPLLRLVAALSFLVLVAACTGGTGETTTTAATSTSGPSTTESTEAGEETTTTSVDTGVGTLSAWQGQRALLTVPLDHDDPAGPTIEVPVWRRPSTEPDRRIGVLFVNPGGPGFPAGDLVAQAEFIYSDDLLAAFDIVALDPRGTFRDTAIDCEAGFAGYVTGVDWSPDAPGEVEALDAHIQANVDACEAEYGSLLDHVSTMDTVHDLALLVGALGEEQATWFGFSYGTTLGAAFITAHPDLVRAAVFDGAYHPYGDPMEESIAQVEAVEASVVALLDGCDADPDCPISSPAEDAFARVAARADVAPFADDPSLPAVNEEAFAVTILRDQSAYGGPAGPLLEAVASADAGDGSLLQARFRAVADFLSAGTAASAISCMDYPYRGETPYPDDAAERLTAAGPTLNRIFPTPEGYDPFAVSSECERWPFGPDLLPIPLSGEGGGPVLVVTATGDPVTPTGSAQALAEELVNETVLVVEDDVHVSYAPSGPPENRCAADLVDRFLIDLDAPPDGTVCAP